MAKRFTLFVRCSAARLRATGSGPLSRSSNDLQPVSLMPARGTATAATTTLGIGCLPRRRIAKAGWTFDVFFFNEDRHSHVVPGNLSGSAERKHNETRAGE